MECIRQVEIICANHSFRDYKWIDPKEVVVEQWIRMKCMFGCSEYGKNATCPPNVPTISECERFFREYKKAIVFHFEKAFDNPDDRHQWTPEINKKLLALERETFLSGFQKAFLLFMDSCNLCNNCTGKRNECNKPKGARPTPEAMGVDLYTTMRKVGYPIEVLEDYGKTINRYAIMKVE